MHVTPFSKSGRSRQKNPAQLRVHTLHSQLIRLLIETQIDGAPARCKLDLTIPEVLELQRELRKALEAAGIREISTRSSAQ